MTPFDLIDLAKRAGSVEELVALARRNRLELSGEDARIYFDRWHGTCELSDDDLEFVGGGVEERAVESYVCEYCGSGNLGIDVSEGGLYCYGCKRRCRGKKA